MKQKDAVFSAISQVLGDDYDGSSVSSLLTKEIRAKVTNILVSGFQAGEIDMDVTFANTTKTNVPKLRAYVSGLISNWVRKDTRLNGNTAYVVKSPGSRKGSGDPQLKALRALYNQATSDSDRNEIKGYIDSRIADLEAAKGLASSKLDISALPEELVAKLGL